MGLTNPQSADHIAAEGGTFEPQRQNNFSLEVALGAADRDLIEMALQGLTVPATINEQVIVQYKNEQRKVAGQATVEDGNLALVDYVDQDTRGAIMRWRKQVYDPETGKLGLAKNYKKTANIILEGPDGATKRVGKLVGVYPPQDPTIDLNMESSDKVLMEVPLSVDKIIWDLPGL